MRTIEFRGKRVDNSEWVYGSLIIDSENSSCQIVIKKGPYFETIDVFPDTVGQFTGCLLDKPGNMIYEGDILAYLDETPEDNDWERMIVTYDEQLQKFGCDFYSVVGGEGYLGQDSLVKLLSKEVKVIGTIHDKKSI